jgi:hypothetical protein
MVADAFGERMSDEVISNLKALASAYEGSYFPNGTGEISIEVVCADAIAEIETCRGAIRMVKGSVAFATLPLADFIRPAK